jgi:hypothetical protein
VVTRVKQWKWTIVAFLLGAFAVPVAAQAIMQLTDGTFATKVVLFDSSGGENPGLTITSITNTVPVSVTNGSATDANSHANTSAGASADADLVGDECTFVTTASTNAASCKTTASNFYGYEFFNTTTTVAYLRLYNLAASPTCSSATGFIRSIPIPPAADTGQVGGAIRVSPFPTDRYGTGVAWCITGGASSTDNTNAGAGIYGAVFAKET